MSKRDFVFNGGEHFGRCAECGADGTVYNIGRQHWMACDKHRVKWCVGENLFSAWRSEPEEVWRDNAERLRDYREVEPAYLGVFRRNVETPTMICGSD